MGRAKKGKKIDNNHDDAGSSEEKIPAQKKRGRPLKPLKDEVDEAPEKMEEDMEDDNSSITNKEMKNPETAENGKRRRRPAQVKEKLDLVKDESNNGSKLSTNDSTKTNGFRHNTSRRKSKPRRAAEAVVECR